MAVPVLLPAFTLGEVSPSLFGRFDVQRMHVAAATFRNGMVSYRGGFLSRAGTAFVGYSMQTGRSFPPRMVPFQFSINQGLTLEFGNNYMRVVANGAFVTESPFAITGITQANPAVVTYAALSTGVAASALNGAVSGSYVRGDTITLAGGTPVVGVILLVNSTTLAKLTLGSGGTGYVVGDRITLAGGTNSLAPVLTVTGVSSGVITSFVISVGGNFTSNGSGSFTQASTTGVGSGATFVGGLFGPNMLTFQNAGSYSALPSNPVNQATTSGSGAGAQYNITWATPGALANGDWLFFSGIGGMSQVNGETYIIDNLTATTFSLTDVFNNPIDSTAFSAFTSAGDAARIFTLDTPWAEADLDYLKFTQSADVMSICCVNQVTLTEYQPVDLARITDTDWTLSPVVASSTVAAPTSPAATASSAGAVGYAYQVTAVNPNDGTESIPSATASLASAVNIAATAGTITVTWTGVPGVNQYNVYKATPDVSGTPPVGVAFGFAGFAYGTQFLDTNIIADFTQVPPTRVNPFARGQILSVAITAAGSGASFTPTINTLTGSGAVLETVVVSNALAAVIVQDPGQDYLPTDTISFTNSATGTLVVGPESGTYPSTVSYFQERRAYANTLNNPDTYFMSQPGSFTNFDVRSPTIASDAITGSPWAVEVNGIQWLIPTSGGLLAMTGLSAWLLVGAGSFATNVQPVSPDTQDAVPQAFSGCSVTVPPIKINYDVLYVNSKGSQYFDLPYQLYTLSEPLDLTENSPHLFNGFSIKEHAYCEQPYRVVWAVRSDGTMLNLTYYKTQQIAGWGRSDTQGLFQSVCAIVEPAQGNIPAVDALYLAVQRFPGANSAYMVERMDNRLWSAVENCWCVDAGLALTQPTPNATLSASSATGLGALSGVTGLVGGTLYSPATTIVVVDAPLLPGQPNGPGTGAVAIPTIVGGVITAVTFSPPGAGYLNPQLTAVDPAGSAGGSGFSAQAVLNNTMAFTAVPPTNVAGPFSPSNVGSIIRMGNGIATITAYISATQVTANITAPITQVLPDSATVTPLTAASGAWTMTAPVTTISGLNHLAGMTVTGLADGAVIPPTTVAANGTITLPQAASAVIVGLGFTAQLQSVYLDGGEPTIQGQRGKIAAVTLRVEASRGLQVGSNQIDGSVLSPAQLAPVWALGAGSMTTVPDKGVPNYGSTIAPLYTGDIRVPVSGGWDTKKQVAVQQTLPLPMNILAMIPELLPGDQVQLKAPTRAEQKRAA